MAPTLLIVDDHAVFRETLCFWLAQKAEVDVVGQAEDGRVAMHMARELHPNLVITDNTMPKLNGIDATREIVRALPETKVLVLADEADSRSVIAALEAGASGYLSKRCSVEELLWAIRNVAAGGTYLSAAANSTLVRHYISGENSGDASRCAGLTARERQVVQLLAEGRTTKMVATELSLSPKTVDWHKGRIMKKLGIHSIAGLVRFAIQEGLAPSVPMHS